MLPAHRGALWDTPVPASHCLRYVINLLLLLQLSRWEL